MKIDLTSFSAVNAAIAILLVIVASWVGIYKAKQISHEHLEQAIDDLSKIADAKDARIGQLQSEISTMQTQLLGLTEKIGQMQGYSESLLRRYYATDRYCETLVETLVRANIPIPPRDKTF